MNTLTLPSSARFEYLFLEIMKLGVSILQPGQPLSSLCMEHVGYSTDDNNNGAVGHSLGRWKRSEGRPTERRN
jgi:hypothetical protein